MADIVSKEVRSRMMSGIRSKNTKPELLIRRGLHRMGLRYSLHRRDLPGKPDLVFTKHNAVLFIHGCFWHGHDCHLFKMPSSRPEFWHAKLGRNRLVDEKATEALKTRGWRIGVVWECALKGKYSHPVKDIIQECYDWLLSKSEYIEIKGRQ